MTRKFLFTDILYKKKPIPFNIAFAPFTVGGLTFSLTFVTITRGSVKYYVHLYSCKFLSPVHDQIETKINEIELKYTRSNNEKLCK